MAVKVSYQYLLSIVFKLVVLLVLLEISFRVLIPATNVPYFVFDNKENILKYDNNKQQDGLYTDGSLAEIRARWHINNMGWKSDRDYIVNNTKPVIAVIGDSYVEAFQVGPGRSMVDNLQKKLDGNYEVYSFGMSGANLSQYLQMTRYVRNNFHPQVIIINIVDGDILESLLVSGNKPGCVYFSYGPSGIIEKLIPYAPSNAKYLYRKSALLRYVKLNNGMLLGGDSPSDSTPSTLTKDEINNSKAFTDYAFSKIRHENPDSTIYIVMDAPRSDIYRGELQRKNIELRNIIATASNAYGFYVVDLTPPMTELYTKKHLKFNFENNYHWNEYGQQVVADQIYYKLVESGIVTPTSNRKNF